MTTHTGHYLRIPLKNTTPEPIILLLKAILAEGVEGVTQPNWELLDRTILHPFFAARAPSDRLRFLLSSSDMFVFADRAGCCMALHQNTDTGEYLLYAHGSSEEFPTAAMELISWLYPYIKAEHSYVIGAIEAAQAPWGHSMHNFDGFGVRRDFYHEAGEHIALVWWESFIAPERRRGSIVDAPTLYPVNEAEIFE